MNNIQIDNHEKYYPKPLTEEEKGEMARARLDLALQRHEILLEKGERWLKITEEENKNC